MAIITISRQAGSLGDETARAVAEHLGYEHIEQYQISKALSSLGFTVSDIDRYDEKKPTIWQTLTMQKELFSYLIRAAIYEFAARKNVVIVGRGGQVILKDIPEALHVRLIAPFSKRFSRLVEQGFDEKKAENTLRQRDRDSSGYLSTYFGSEWDDSDLYDLVINTRTMTVSECVDVICTAVGAEKIKSTPQNSEKLYDLALTYKGRAALLKATESLEWADLEVENGVAALSGIVGSSEVKRDCEKVISDIQGIKSVENHLGIRAENKRLF